jgi:hypothetical protein
MHGGVGGSHWLSPSTLETRSKIMSSFSTRSRNSSPVASTSRATVSGHSIVRQFKSPSRAGASRAPGATKAPTVRRLLTRGNFNFDSVNSRGRDSFRLAPEPGSGLARAAPATGGRNRRRSGAAPARLLACQVRAGGEPGPTAQGTFIGCRSPTGIGCGASSLLSWEPAHVRQHRLKQEKLEKEKANATEERRKKEVAEKALEALGPKPTDGD